ncbi:hypothetical protein COLO4_07216 [Corchorus olitorius]|uniref:Uncharacterized protein n=1 Tax=Corchorus olitorius TaxID=93759 RepID=A0A1R3KKJ4_9ROSI|nr:hypothetical protein COLO4_07216 [Corchorus olitorius]
MARFFDRKIRIRVSAKLDLARSIEIREKPSAALRSASGEELFGGISDLSEDHRSSGAAAPPCGRFQAVDKGGAAR